MPEVGLVAETAAADAGPGAQGDAALDGGALEPGPDWRGLGERVGGRVVVFRLELAAGEQLSDPGEEPVDPFGARLRKSSRLDGARVLVQHQAVFHDPMHLSSITLPVLS